MRNRNILGTKHPAGEEALIRLHLWGSPDLGIGRNRRMVHSVIALGTILCLLNVNSYKLSVNILWGGLIGQTRNICLDDQGPGFSPGCSWLK